jgi:hypothetical protein
VSCALNPALTEEVEVTLEGDDPVRVLACSVQRRMRLSADDLVHAVEAGKPGDLHHASLGGRREAPGRWDSVEGRHGHAIEATPGLGARQYGYLYS